MKNRFLPCYRKIRGTNGGEVFCFRKKSVNVVKLFDDLKPFVERGPKGGHIGMHADGMRRESRQFVAQERFNAWDFHHSRQAIDKQKGIGDWPLIDAEIRVIPINHVQTNMSGSPIKMRALKYPMANTAATLGLEFVL